MHFLSPLGKIYANIMRAREILYKKGVFPSWRPPGFCISVGNLCVGGTGKTPVCEWLLDWSLQQGRKPALLSRGYKGRGRDYPYLLTSESKEEVVGDEPLMLVRSIPGASVVVDPKRSRGGRFVYAKQGTDLFILDDGFQHMCVQRDLNLLLLKPEDLSAEWNKVVPRGLWREGVSALKRASAFVLDATHTDMEALRPWIEQRLKPWGKPVFIFYRKFKSFSSITTGDTFYKPFFDKYLLLSAVGNPCSVFYNAIEACGNEPVMHLVYPDHYMYTKADLEIVKQKALQNGAETILCTSKDGVKLKDLADETVYELQVEIEFATGYFVQKDFSQWLESQVS